MLLINVATLRTLRIVEGITKGDQALPKECFNLGVRWHFNRERLNALDRNLVAVAPDIHQIIESLWSRSIVFPAKVTHDCQQVDLALFRPITPDSSTVLINQCQTVKLSVVMVEAADSELKATSPEIDGKGEADLSIRKTRHCPIPLLTERIFVVFWFVLLAVFMDQHELLGRTEEQLGQRNLNGFHTSNDCDRRYETAGLGQWTESRMMPKAKPQLGFYPPMEATAATSLPSGSDWNYEIKYDGYRIQAHKLREQITLFSRRGHDFTNRFPTIVEGLRDLAADGLILDGEAVALDDTGRHVFHLLQRTGQNKAPVHYFAFDVLATDGRDITGERLNARRERLEKILMAPPDYIHLSPILAASPNVLLEAVAKHGFEGVMAKHADSVYQPGERPGTWLKHKVQPSDDFLVGGYIPGSTGLDELLVGRLVKGELLMVGSVRAGFVPRSRRLVLDALRPYRQRRTPFVNLPRTRRGRAEKFQSAQWVKPAVVVEIAFNNLTPEGRLRHSRFLRLREQHDISVTP